jgi:hypothetical protein
VPEDTTDFNLRRLRNVVEEIAIASGVPVPRIFVLEHEAGINAFAAGYAPADAVIAVTRGALERLNRDELQGVIAHEFSHVLNGDMRLNIRLIGVLFGIMVLAIIGRKVLLFGDGLGLAGLFATHPPLVKRIQALEPGFRAEQLEQLRARWRVAPPVGAEEDLQLGLVESGTGVLPAAATEVTVTPPMVAAQVASPASDDYRRADAISARIPDELRKLAAGRETVMPLLLGLLLGDDARLRDNQSMEIAARLGSAMAAAAVQCHAGLLEGLHPILRLPLAALAFPVLRLRPRPELATFMDTVHAVVHADGEVSLFEYCLGKLLQVQVVDSLEPGRHAGFGRRKLPQAGREIATLLCVVARSGHADPQQAQRAYLAGIARVLPRAHLPYLERDGGVRALDGVWEALDALDPLARQALVEGITATIAHDDRVTVAESELLRTICGVLRCPLPPMLENA